MKRRVLRFARFISLLIALFFLAFLPFAYHFYSTLGIDTDRTDGPASIYYRYYRVRWRGDGTVEIGSGAHHYAANVKKPEPFDLAGRFFDPPRPGTVRNRWNALGFRRKLSRAEDEFSVRDASLLRPYQNWVGMPAWLPVIFFGGLALILRAAERKTPESSAKSSP
ncbi:MAG: hypothetical protein SFU56_17935 [Capsulimonadales bacterium]|nr:hypothetical protein [Capsulimonadales bacterium]